MLSRADERRPHQPHIVIDMLEHIHQKNQIALFAADLAQKANRFAIENFLPLLLISRIDANRRCGAPLEKPLRKDARARPDIEQRAKRPPTKHRVQREPLGAIIPMPI